MIKSLTHIILFSSLIFLVGCDSFNRKWSSKIQEKNFNQGETGLFKGHWMSDTNFHNGALYCIIEKGKNGKLDAIFKAKYKRVLVFNYSLPIQATQEKGFIRLKGSADLGKLHGGYYRFDGLIKNNQVDARYYNEYDKGYFKMTRVFK